MVESYQSAETKYAPLSSVWEGSDGELIELMLEFYAAVDPEPILDATYNRGRFWKGSTRRVVSMDIDPKYAPMIVGDNREMVGILDAQYGTVVYDPPHVGPKGETRAPRNSMKILGRLYRAEKKKTGTSVICTPRSWLRPKEYLDPTVCCWRRLRTW